MVSIEVTSSEMRSRSESCADTETEARYRSSAELSQGVGAPSYEAGVVHVQQGLHLRRGDGYGKAIVVRPWYESDLKIL